MTAAAPVRFSGRRPAIAPENEFVAMAYPRALTLEKCRAEAVLAFNWQMAVEGRVPPGDGLVLGHGLETEVDAVLARARSLPAGGLCGVEYLPPPRDEVAITRLGDITARGRDLFARGVEDTERRLLVAIGDRATCDQEATRLRRIRAGRRSQEARSR